MTKAGKVKLNKHYLLLASLLLLAKMMCVKILLFNNCFKTFSYWLEGGERERNINLLFHPFMHSSVASSTCPDRGLDPQPWRIRIVLQPTEPLGQGLYFLLVH